MNVGQLKKIIVNIPDDVLILADASCHERRLASLSDWFVVQSLGGGMYWEYFGDEYMEPDDLKIRALVVK